MKLWYAVTVAVATLLVATVTSAQSNKYQLIIDDIAEQSGVVVTVEQLQVFETAGKRHGVHWQVLVSQWYQESRCSANMGSSNPLEVLAGNEKQLAALRSIMAQLGLDASQVKSGGAGELGPVQFRPHIWSVYGRDLDGDGRANPWDLTEAADAAARFLKQDCGYNGRNTVFGAVAHYNGGFRRRWSNEHYANTVIRRAARWGAQLEL